MSVGPRSQLDSTNPIGQLAIPLNPRLAVRLYEDSRPHCMETSTLQKGLVLTCDEKEIIEEGMGFGVPIVKYKDKTFFSSTAEIAHSGINEVLLKKRFVIDTVSKKTWKGSPIDDKFYSKWRKRFAKFYLTRKELSPLFNRLMEYRQLAGIRTEFVKIKSRGTIDVEYQTQKDGTVVNVDFQNLALDRCEELLVLNEQGSTFFNSYFDSNGLKLVGNKIGGWGIVNASHAYLKSEKFNIAFKLCKKSEATLFRGWERTKNRFSWAGLSYSLPPTHRSFEYKIDVEI